MTTTSENFALYPQAISTTSEGAFEGTGNAFLLQPYKESTILPMPAECYQNFVGTAGVDHGRTETKLDIL